jgi:hypothetical protein
MISIVKKGSEVRAVLLLLFLLVLWICILEGMMSYCLCALLWNIPFDIFFQGLILILSNYEQR